MVDQSKNASAKLTTFKKMMMMMMLLLLIVEVEVALYVEVGRGEGMDGAKAETTMFEASNCSCMGEAVVKALHLAVHGPGYLFTKALEGLAMDIQILHPCILIDTKKLCHALLSHVKTAGIKA